jgi:hypothetical protein
VGTKQFSNYESLLTFTRASKGHALRPVSYGSELVTNGDYSNGTTGWTNDSSLTMDTFEVASGRLHIENTAGTTQAAYTDDNISLVAGKIYKFTAELEKVSGNDNWDIDIRVAALSTVRHTMTSTATTETLQVIFVATQTENTVIQITTRDTFEGYIDNVSIKEVTFDKSDGILTLFEHPNNIPRVEWDAQRNRLGLLVEEARTNLWVFSEDMSQTSFGGTGGTATTDQYVAPDGTQTGDLVTMTSGQVYAYKSVTISTPTNVAYTISCYVKAAEANTSVGFRIGEFGGAAAGKFHDSDYTAISSTEWTRLDFTQTLEQSDRTQVQAVIRTTSATGSLLIWGVQLEQGSFPTSYIKTTSSTATRSSELADVLVDNFGYNNSNEGTFVIHAKNLSYNPNGTDYPFLVRFDNATNSNDRLGIFLSEASGNLVAEIKRNNVTQMSPVFKTATGGAVDEIVVAFAFAEDDFAVSDDGDAVITDTAGTLVPSSPIAKIGLGQAFNSVHMNAHITSFQYYPRRLTNAQIEDLSS